MTLTWTNPGDNFKLVGLRIRSHGKLVALGRPQKKVKPKRLKVKTIAKSSTFRVLRIGHLRRGVLHFAVKAAKASGGTAKVTTQIGR